MHARLLHDALAFGGAGAGRQRAARPDGAFIQVRQELGTDDAAHGEIDEAPQARRATASVTQRMRMASARARR